MRIKQSICYPIFRREEMSLKELFAAAAKIGYAAAELWDPPDDLEEIVALARERGLVVASISGHHSLTDGLNKRENHKRIEAELIASIDRTAGLGIPGLICFSGNRYEGVGDDEAIEIVADGLKRVAARAEAKGVNLNLELLNSRKDHPGYQCDHTDWGVAVCERVGSPRVKLLYDIYHMQIMEGDVIQRIRDHVQWIGHFHTAGVPGRHDFDDTQELNYAGICKAIAATDYAGYLGHEFSPKGDPIEALRRAFEICDQG
jgi:hydroxypyruvate isomerase